LICCEATTTATPSATTADPKRVPGNRCADIFSSHDFRLMPIVENRVGDCSKTIEPNKIVNTFET
jgi:hypothetical protein